MSVYVSLSWCVTWCSTPAHPGGSSGERGREGGGGGGGGGAFVDFKAVPLTLETADVFLLLPYVVRCVAALCGQVCCCPVWSRVLLPFAVRFGAEIRAYARTPSTLTPQP